MKPHVIQSIIILCLLALSSCQKSYWENDAMKKALSTPSFTNPHMTCAAYRLDDSYPGEREKQEGESLHGYAILSDAEALTYGARQELSSIIDNPNTYFRYEVPPDCLFRPGVAFRFKDKKTKVDLLVCFSCSELRYYMDGKVVGQSFFQSKKLLSLVKELFPDDEKIQSLK
jgi:hypothetical protein